jgi:spermidine synthase
MPRFSALLAASVAISGASSLIYELLWIRALGLHFGTTTPAITTVIATFMAGLGLGNLWFGARADRSTRPFALYRRLELAIGLSGLLTSLVLLRAGGLLDALAKLCVAAGSLATFARTGVLAVLMLVPATAMGGTLPVLSRALSTRGQPGRSLGLLYACNTLGAVAGALTPDFLFIPRFGLTWTACLAACGNLFVVAALGGYSRVEVAAIAQPKGGTRSRAALALSAASGFCALGLEVLWSRTLQHWATSLVTSFAVLLAVYLIALSCGALIAQRFADRSQEPLRRAALLLGLSACCALIAIAVSPSWRGLERAWWPRPSELRRMGLVHEALDAALHAGFLEGAVCLLLGAAFPFVARAWLSDGPPGVRTGQLLVVNTFAGVLGALVVGFVCLPMFGEQASYCALALLLGGVAALCAWRSAPTLVCLAAVLSLGAWLPAGQLFRAHFRTGGEVIAVREGATTTAVAVARYVYGERYYAELLTPGVSMSHTRLDARRYMALMAHAALLATPRAERALLICYGVGNTASALLSHAGLQRLDVVDISPEVLALAPEFAAVRGDDPLADPRTHVCVDDGRHHLITHEARYDVITAEPPPPNYAGVVNLYSREFYQLAKRRLAPGGVVTQWLPVFQLADSDVRAMIAAFVAELPHAALLYGYEQQWILIGSLQPIVLDARRDVAGNLRANGIGGVEDVLGSVIQTDAELRLSAAGVEPLSDERPTLQYPFEALSARTLYTPRSPPNPQRAFGLLGAEPDPALRHRVERAWQATQRALSALPILQRDASASRELALGRLLQPALSARPDDEGLWALLGVDGDRVRLAERALARPGAREVLAQPRAAPARYGVLHDAAWLLARRAFYARDYASALGLLAQIAPEPQQLDVHALLRAGALRALGQTEASASAFRAAAAASRETAFRTECAALADHAALPFTPEAGPWSVIE